MSNVLIVGGASGGFGGGMVDQLRDDGHEVIVLGQSAGFDYKIDAARPGSIADGVELAVGAFEGKLDIAIYNAGLSIGKDRIEDGSRENWNHVMQVNVLGMLELAKATIPHLAKTKGLLITVGSISAGKTYVGGVDYAAAKAAVKSASHGLRLETFQRGIRVCCIHPGLGDTNFLRRRYSGDEEKMAKHGTHIQMLAPTDVGAAVRWVASMPKHVNIDDITIKPTAQAEHGVLATDDIF